MKKNIEVTKDGKNISVHPSTVKEHLKAGWKLVDLGDLVDLALAGHVDQEADPAPFEKLIELSKGSKIIKVNMADVQSYVTGGWKVVDPNDVGDLVTRGLLVPQAESTSKEKLVRMVKVGHDVLSPAGESIDVHPSAVAAHVQAGWKVAD
jgi:hypothetical protein